MRDAKQLRARHSRGASRLKLIPGSAGLSRPNRGEQHHPNQSTLVLSPDEATGRRGSSLSDRRAMPGCDLEGAGADIGSIAAATWAMRMKFNTSAQRYTRPMASFLIEASRASLACRDSVVLEPAGRQ